MVWPRLQLTSILPPPRDIKDLSTKEWATKLNTFLDDYIRKTALKVNEITTDISAGAVLESAFDAHTILYAVTDNTPTTLTIAASRVVGRKASGNICAMTGAETRTVLGIDTDDSVTFGSVTVGTLTISDGSIDDTDGTINLGATNLSNVGTIAAGAITGTSFIIGANQLTTTEWAYLDGQNQHVKITSSPTFSNPTVSTLAFNFATQDYKFTHRSDTFLVLQSQTSNQNPAFEIFTKDGDGVANEAVYLHLFGKGTPSDVTTYELLEIGYLTNGAHAIINTRTVNATLADLALYTGDNTTQLVLATDGDISMGGALAVTGNVTGANLNISNWDDAHTHISSDGSDHTFIDQAVTQAASPIFVMPTVSELLFDFDTQDYKFTNRDNSYLAIQSQTSNLDFVFEMFTKDGDRAANEALYFHLWGKGTPASTTNREIFTFGYTHLSGLIYTQANGTGTVLPIAIYTGAHTDQLVLATTGDNTMSGALGVTGTVTGGAFTTAGDITTTAGNVYGDGLFYYTDSTTNMAFGGGTIVFKVTNVEFLRLVNSPKTQDYVAVNNDLADLDFIVKGDTDAALICTDAANDKVGIGDAAPGEKLDVAGNINATGVLKIDDVQVVKEQQVHIADSSTQDLTGTDTIHQANLESDLANIVAAVNAILAMVEAHGLTAAA